MTTGLLFDAGLCLLILAVALSAVAGRDLFGSIAFFLIYGILIALAWLRLEAFDVALAEAAIGAGLTGVLLIGAWSMLHRAGVPAEPPRPSRALRLAVAGLSAGVVALLWGTVLQLPPDDAGLVLLVRENLAASGVTNPVTAVLLNFRAYDTLLESIVLVIALVAVWSLTPKEVWGGVPGLRQHARPDGILATFGRLLPPLGLVIGVYLVWAGSTTLGGAFQAGTVLAAVWLLVVMAGIRDEPAIASLGLRTAIVIGPAIFLCIGAVGAVLGGFLSFPEAHAKALILVIEYVLTISIAATLALLVAGVPRRTA